MDSVSCSYRLQHEHIFSFACICLHSVKLAPLKLLNYLLTFPLCSFATDAQTSLTALL